MERGRLDLEPLDIETVIYFHYRENSGDRLFRIELFLISMILSVVKTLGELGTGDLVIAIAVNDQEAFPSRNCPGTVPSLRY